MQQLKQRYIRWYYGHFHYDPQHDETFNFGLVRPLGAMRLSRIFACMHRNRFLLAAAGGSVTGVLLYALAKALGLA